MNPDERRRLVAANSDLFKLGWPANPDSLRGRGREHRLTDPHMLEMSAWCAELHLQLEELARTQGVALLLMGGNAAALRLAASEQRGSRDNDYLTTATKGGIERLMSELLARFEARFPEPYFRFRKVEPKDAEPLPLVTFAIDVPALFDTNAPDGKLGIKVEFHIEDPELFPQAEEVDGEFLAVGEAIRTQIPSLPHQIALKLMTLAGEPVGIDAAREDAVPRQLYDLDALIRQVDGEGQWRELHDYATRRYAKETKQRSLPPGDGAPWGGMLARLDNWSACQETGGRHWRLIRSFQESQLARSSQRSAVDWLGRIRRLQVAVRCLVESPQNPEAWQRILEVEALLEPRASGARLRSERMALHPLVGVPPRRQHPRPRVTYWEHLAGVADLNSALGQLSALKRLAEA